MKNFLKTFFLLAAFLMLPNLAQAATIFQDNFNYSDAFTNHGWGEVSATSSITSGAGPDGSNCLKVTFDCDSNTSCGDRPMDYSALSGQYKELWVKFSFKIQGNAIGGAKFLKMFGVRDGESVVYANSTTQIVWQTGVMTQLIYGASGDTRDADTGLSYSSTIDARDGQWHTWKLHMKYNDNSSSNGAYGVWYDGTQILNATGINNRSNNDSQYFGKIQLGGWNQDYGGTPYYIYYDNLVIADSDPDSGGGSDTTPPTVTAFTMPSTYTSLTVPITAYTIQDETALAAAPYCVTSTNSTTNCDWLASHNTSFTFAHAGAQTAYAWAKDAAGNISSSASDTVTITLGDTTPPAAPSGLSVS